MINSINKALLLFISVCCFTTSSFANMNFLTKARDLYNIKVRGVIHIGASLGQEFKFYRNFKVKDILWIEADPETYAKLVNNVNPNTMTHKINSFFQPESITENFAASDKDGEAEFFVTNNKDSSSLMDLKLHEVVYPDITVEKKIKVKTKRLDTYFEMSGNDLRKYNAIVIDVQGGELLALSGAVHTLKAIDVIVAEISPAEMYNGSVKVYELDQFLLDQGFVRLDTSMITKICGDALYIKRNVIKNSFENM